MSLSVVYVPRAGGPARARASRVLTRALRRAGATREDKAITLEPHSRVEARELERLVAWGAVRHGRKGGYWLDEDRYREIRHARWRIAAMIVLVEAGVLLALFLNLPQRIH